LITQAGHIRDRFTFYLQRPIFSTIICEHLLCVDLVILLESGEDICSKPGKK